MNMRAFRPVSPPLPRYIRWLLASIPIVGAMAALARGAKAAADNTYVLRDSFALFQQGLVQQRHDDSTQRASSLVEVLHVVKGIDSTQRCDHGHREFCR